MGGEVNMDSVSLYKMLNDRVQKEIDELYQIQVAHATGVGALLAVCTFAKTSHWVLLSCGITGIFVCCTWWLGYKGQERWKLWWTIELAKIECKLGDVSIWRKLVFEECKDNEELMQRLGRPSVIVDPPPKMNSVDGFARFRPIFFGLLFVVIAGYAGLEIIL